MESSRGKWGSKAGFILAASGSAVGLGNIWKYPYIAGENGGAAFTFVYLICIAVVGLPILLSEFVIGRKTQLSPVGAFEKLVPKTKWKYIGFLGVASAFVILSFYSVIFVVGIICSLYSNVFGFLDAASSKYMLPIGGLLTAIFIVYRWGLPKFLDEIMEGRTGNRPSTMVVKVIFIIAAVVVFYIIANEIVQVISGSPIIG